jgi:hypothetical protein
LKKSDLKKSSVLIINKNAPNIFKSSVANALKSPPPETGTELEKENSISGFSLYKSPQISRRLPKEKVHSNPTIKFKQTIENV